MNAREIVEKLPIFRGADPADLNALAAIAVQNAYGPDDCIFTSSRPADALIAIIMGTAEVTAEGAETAVFTMGSGQMLGLLRFFERSDHGGTAHTREPTRTLHLPFAKLDQLLAER